MINGRTCLHVVANGTMTGQRYIDEVLLPHVRLFRGAVGDKFVFVDDNATCHRTLAVQDCLDSEGIQRLVWPARSSDLNPIENVWDVLGRQVASRNYPPTNKNTLIRALTEEWDKLPQQLLNNFVQRGRYPVRGLMDDNCRPHHANLVEDFLFEEGIVGMEWPACSPDMNPIEHVWDALERRVAGRQPPPQTLQELERALLEEWDRILQLVSNSLIDSMPQRCSTLLAVRGNHTPY
ncbi:transposable element Tcb2 transposase [Trichonephila clavipes]|nr:transposable element Tcb2 transposase [Trichonephila clavipes]